LVGLLVGWFVVDVVVAIALFVSLDISGSDW